MQKSGRPRRKWVGWVLGAGLAVLFAGVVVSVFLPVLVVKWLGGDDFRRLASKQISTLLRTEGELQPLEWSSFSVYSGGFRSRPDAPGPWNWNLQELRTEISPRLLLDRVLRFSTISVDVLSLTPGTRPAPTSPPAQTETTPSGSSPEIFRDVQVGSLEIRSLQVPPAPATGGWGIEDLQITLQPSKQKTDFTLQNGKIASPWPWLGPLKLDTAKGRYAEPTLYLTSLEAKSTGSGTLQASGEFSPGTSPRAQGRVTWDRWAIPGGTLGVGLFQMTGWMSGDFVLQELRAGLPVGQGQIRLVDARLEPGTGSETILALLGLLTGEPRLQGCSLSTANAQWSMQPGIYDVNRFIVEAPGLLRATGKVQAFGEKLSGEILFGLEKGLGSKVNTLTGGECFRREENGYLVETILISGTLQRPRNDLQPKLTSAMARTAVRTGAQILEKAAGAQGGGGDAAKAAGQILNSIFGAPPGR